jgi:hypothetical protein
VLLHVKAHGFVPPGKAGWHFELVACSTPIALSPQRYLPKLKMKVARRQKGMNASIMRTCSYYKIFFLRELALKRSSYLLWGTRRTIFMTAQTFSTQ